MTERQFAFRNALVLLTLGAILDGGNVLAAIVIAGVLYALLAPLLGHS